MAARKARSGTQYIGLTDTARKFIRRHDIMPDPANIATGLDGEEVALTTWRHSHPGSHLKLLRERVQHQPVDGNVMYIFTYLEAEYACGCKEPMFQWRTGLDDRGNRGLVIYDRARGAMFI